MTRRHAQRRFWHALLLVIPGTVVAGACGSSGSTAYAEVDHWECFERLPPVIPMGGAGGVSENGGASAGGGSGSGGADAAGGADAEGGESSCDCYGLPAGEHAKDPKPSVPGCADWTCCFAWNKSDGSYACRCAVAPVCSTLAASYDAEVVDACPPTPRDNPTYCAFGGESCDADYLTKNGLSGCCEDLDCRLASNGLRLCQ